VAFCIRNIDKKKNKKVNKTFNKRRAKKYLTTQDPTTILINLSDFVSSRVINIGSVRCKIIKITTTTQYVPFKRLIVLRISGGLIAQSHKRTYPADRCECTARVSDKNNNSTVDDRNTFEMEIGDLLPEQERVSGSV